MAISRNKNIRVLSVLLGTAMLMATGCNRLPEQAEANAQARQSAEQTGAIPVDVAIAQRDILTEAPEYTGTTAAAREVGLRSQIAAQVLNIFVDVGDVVKKGQVVAQLDDALLISALKQEQAELAGLKATVARAQNQVSNARANVERSRLELQQAQADLQRQQQLLSQGAVAAQETEQARTTAQTAAQSLRAAQEQVRTEQQAQAAASAQVNAQQAAIAQANEQLSYAKIRSPIAGIVTQRLTEAGNLVQTNGELMRIGDFSRVQVNVTVSELELAKIRTGQSVRVRLDAFPKQSITGRVSRISPAADQVARLIPVQVVIPNSNGRIGSGLLARVQFATEEAQKIVVPSSAIQGTQAQNNSSPQQGTVFVVNGEGEATVTARRVTLGAQANDKVEILSGLQAGERFVARSGKPLKNGASVKFSILSESQQEG